MQYLQNLKSRRDELKVLYLLTPQHTGTHFCRMILETHPKIAPCVYAEMVKAEVPRKIIALRYLRQAASLEEWKDLIIDELLLRQEELQRRTEEHFGEIRVCIEEKTDPLYLFFHERAHERFLGSVDSDKYQPFERFQNVETVITIRDPRLVHRPAEG